MQKCNFHYAAMSIWRHRSWNLWISQKCESLDISRTNYYFCFKYQELPSYQENPVTKNSGKVSGIKATHGSRILPKVKKQITNNLQAKDSPKLSFLAVNICTLWERVSEVTISETYIWINNVFEPNQYFSFPVPERKPGFS